MLHLLLSVLVAFLSTPAQSAPYWITQYMWKIDQAPLTENALTLAPAGNFPQEQPSALRSSSPLSLVYQFEEAAILENIAVRHNNHLLLTPTNQAGVHYLNPATKENATLVAEFPNATSTIGIDETTQDVFIVAVGNYSTKTFRPVEGTFSIWSLDFNKNPDQPTKKKITDIEDAWGLNGLTALDGFSDLVLVADSGRGWIWRVNTTSGEFDVAQKHVLYTNFTAEYPNTNPLGINGIKVHEGYLYFINSAQATYGRVAIDATGNATAEPQVIARAGPETFAWDDLVIGWGGTAWIAAHADAVTQINLDGKQRNHTAGASDTVIEQPTSLAWGRGSAHSKDLYIVTAGDLEKGTPGQVMALDTSLVK